MRIEDEAWRQSPFTGLQAVRAGYSRDEIARALQRGEWTRLRHGVYIEQAAYAAASPGPERHRLLVQAHLLKHGPGTVASHRSAASLLGLALLREPDGVDLTRPDARCRSGNLLGVHQSPLSATQMQTDSHGVATTSVARTVLDLARTLSFRQGVVVADSALHQKLTDTPSLAAELELARQWPGSPNAGRVVAAADARSESPGESLARLDLHALGYTSVQPQLEVQGLSGKWYRGDLVIEELGVIVEFDGKVKYQDTFGRTAEQVREAQAFREDDLRHVGWGFARLVWADLGVLHRIERKVQAARLASSRRARLTG